MKIAIYSQTGEKKGDTDLPKSLQYEAKSSALCEYINYIRSLSHACFASAKDRSEVSGGGKKPWKQKGTGHARHGSSRSPIWSGGGVTFGPNSDRNHALMSNKSFRKNMKNAIYSTLAKEKRIKIIDSIELKELKTKEATEFIDKMDVSGKISLIISKEESSQKRAFQNLPYINLGNEDNQNMILIASSDYLIITKKAFTNIFK